MSSLERQSTAVALVGWFTTFYIRRFFRIFPLSVLVILIVYLFRLPVGHLRDGIFYAVQLHPRQLLSNLLLVQNLTGTESIIAPLWSLPYEIQMYLVLPVLYLIVRLGRNPIPAVILWAASTLVAMRALHVHRFQVPDLFQYVPCFVSGILAYKLTKSHSLNLSFFLWPLTLAAVTVFYLYDPGSYKGWICCLLIGATVPQFRDMRPGILFRVCHLVARYSYGVYLSHFAVIWLAFVALHNLPVAARWLVFLIGLVVFPVLLYHTIEAPMIAFGREWLAQLSNRSPHSSQPILRPS